MSHKIKQIIKTVVRVSHRQLVKFALSARYHPKTSEFLTGWGVTNIHW
jgi:hypothetical protein